MKLPFRLCLAILTVAVLAAAVVPSWGFYTPWAVAGALAALAVALAASTLPDWSLEAPAGWRRSVSPAVLVAALALALSGQGMLFAELNSEPLVPQAIWVMEAAAIFGFLATASLVPHAFSTSVRWRPWLALQIAVLFLTGAAVRISAIVAMPNPRIDLYDALQEAPEHLLMGQNPYSATYTWPYPHPKADYDRAPFYPPLPILIGVPFRAAGLDVRFANAMCDILAAFVLLAAGWSRGQTVIGAMAAAAFLHFPRVPFMMAQAWYEPMLAAALGGGLLLVERGQRFGFFLLGLGLTGKQYGVSLLLPLLKTLGRCMGWLILGIGLAAALVIGPFFLWDPPSFLDVVIVKHLERPVRHESISLHAVLEQSLGYPVPRYLVLGLAGVLVAAITLRSPRRTITAAFWMGAALLTFCLFHSQGFLTTFIFASIFFF